ncbi:hypothetical protein PR048_010759 [Dryococelus australis]|uniref:Uncharacterized protein n=1 Tax=Dryococelus australis TaxID=614101 RepID=A0ABQ9I3L5_9NEOP|nr:hypothetical protein PR048_010759 [Dryococelus australis]
MLRKIPYWLISRLESRIPSADWLTAAFNILLACAIGVHSILTANRVRFPAGSLPDFRVGIVPVDPASRKVFSGISRFPRPFIMALLHTYLASPSSALKTSAVRSARSQSHDTTPAPRSGDRYKLRDGTIMKAAFGRMTVRGECASPSQLFTSEGITDVTKSILAGRGIVSKFERVVLAAPAVAVSRTWPALSPRRIAVVAHQQRGRSVYTTPPLFMSTPPALHPPPPHSKQWTLPRCCAGTSGATVTTWATQFSSAPTGYTHIKYTSLRHVGRFSAGSLHTVQRVAYPERLPPTWCSNCVSVPIAPEVRRKHCTRVHSFARRDDIALHMLYGVDRSAVLQHPRVVDSSTDRYSHHDTRMIHVEGWIQIPVVVVFADLKPRSSTHGDTKKGCEEIIPGGMLATIYCIVAAQPVRSVQFLSPEPRATYQRTSHAHIGGTATPSRLSVLTSRHRSPCSNIELLARLAAGRRVSPASPALAFLRRSIRTLLKTWGYNTVYETKCFEIKLRAESRTGVNSADCCIGSQRTNRRDSSMLVNRDIGVKLLLSSCFSQHFSPDQFARLDGFNCHVRNRIRSLLEDQSLTPPEYEAFLSPGVTPPTG